ncbi:uncharacterized protein MAM_00441 [Metarhizium album ARSEF 1941]|uniref:Uncharacterized protein n=1 Tax=Metarhizium album (strain ARSEF 1941) TaxID=1081103 RepID=A0A0B2X7F8_METAS|nr:uncharacterized protein MAM_00441 [Metarhizium album ARSEF 1941]KHO01440.1 hypothetical protein MAM_00441 [Metarhizium album ARSEF 1941]
MSQPLALGLPESCRLQTPDLVRSCSSWSDKVYATESTMGPLSPYAPACQVGHGEEAVMPGAMSSQELDLLGYYMAHPGRIIPFAQEDLYAPPTCEFPTLCLPTSPSWRQY